MKFSFIILFLGFTLRISAQDNTITPINTSYPEGQKHESYFVNEKNKKEGLYQSWLKDGRIVQIGIYSNGTMVGVWKEWFYFDNNAHNEITREYDGGGKIQLEIDSLWKERNETNLSSQYLANVKKTTYNDSNQILEYIGWHSNGKISNMGKSINGSPDGITTWWRRDGSKQHEVYSSIGKSIWVKSYSKLDKLEQEKFFEENKLSLVRNYNPETGKLISEKFFDKNEKLIKEVSY